MKENSKGFAMTSTPERKRILVLQHISCEPPATYEGILIEYGIEIDRIQLDEGGRIPDHFDYIAIIAMGGPMGAQDDNEYPWISGERDYIKTAVEQGIPYWGVCLGAQLLAASMGSNISTGDVPEVGSYDVSLTHEGKEDVVFRDLPEHFSVFQWHSDTFDLPDGFIRIASSDLYPNQVIARGGSYGIQFHVEVDSSLAAEWKEVPSYQESLESLYGEDAAARVFSSLSSQEEHNRHVATRIFRNWLSNFVL